MRIGFMVVFASTILLQSCDPLEGARLEVSNPNLNYFGFSLVDVGWDDTTDGVSKTNYVDEVAPFSNMADMLVAGPETSIVERLRTFEKNRVQAVVHVHELFFALAGTGGNFSGRLYDLRPDYRSRWDAFVALNQLPANSGLVRVWYLGEEPTWNGISFDELRQAADYLKATTPNIPVMLVEAYPAIDALQVPTSIDWIGFDHYFILDPYNDAAYKREFSLLKTKLSAPGQGVVLVMDAHYIPGRHLAAGIWETDMKKVADSYFKLANADSVVVALIGYFWPGGFDDPSAKGARNLPQSVKDEYTRIGKAISGK